MSESETASRSPHFQSDAMARTYEEIMLPRIFEPWAEVLLDAVAPAPGEAVLDVATGPGTVAHLVARRVGESGRVTGVDLSAAMLAVARRRPGAAGMAQVEYVEAPADHLPLPDSTYDLALCQQGLQHMTDPVAGIREMYRTLKPTGRIGLAAWTESPFGLFRRALGELGSGGGPQPSSFGSNADEFARIVEDVGFHNVKVETRELTVTLEGGIEQALRIAEATSVGPVLAEMPAAEQERARDEIRSRLQPFVDGTAVRLRTGSNIAVGQR